MSFLTKRDFLVHQPDITTVVIVKKENSQIDALMHIDTDQNDYNRTPKSLSVVDLADAKLTLEFDGFDKLDRVADTNHCLINGNVHLVVERKEQEAEKLLLASPKIPVFPISSPRKRDLVWPDLNEVRSNIRNAWMDTFAESMADFHDQAALITNSDYYDMEAESEMRRARKDSRKSRAPAPSIRWSTVGGIVGVAAVIIVAFKLLTPSHNATQPSIGELTKFSQPTAPTQPVLQSPGQVKSLNDPNNTPVSAFGLQDDAPLSK